MTNTTVISESVLPPDLLSSNEVTQQKSSEVSPLLTRLLVQYGALAQAVDPSLLVKNWVNQFDEDNHSVLI